MKQTSYYIQLMLQDFVCHLIDIWNSVFRKKTTPSYIALNINWFTNCSWLEQLAAFNQLEDYLDHDKSHVK